MRDVKKLDALAIQQQPEFKRLANLLDPCFTGTAHSDTVTVQGKTDTISAPGSIVFTKVSDTVIKTVTLPSKRITATVYKMVHDTISDNRMLSAATALYSVKSDSLTIIKTQLTQKIQAKKTWMWIAIGALVVILAFIVIKHICAC